MKLNNACSKICKLNFNDLNPIRWLFSDIKQSMEIADQYNLFEDLDISNLKIIKPSSKEIYSRCFNILKKLCLLPIVLLTAEIVIEILWHAIDRVKTNDYYYIYAAFIKYAYIFYWALMWPIFFRLVWKYNLIILAVCPNLKHGEQIAFILRSYAKFWLKMFLTIMFLSSLIPVFIYHAPVVMLSFFPCLIVSWIITSVIFNMEQERLGLQVIFNNISMVINKISRAG